MTRHVLLIGGRGLIGSQVARSGEERGWQVTIVARAPDPQRGVLHAGTDRELLAVLGLERWYGVIDFRAFDVDGVKAVLPELDPQTAYLMLSSIYAYCHPFSYPGRDLRRLVETAALTPSGPYGEGKVRAELETTRQVRPEERYVVRLPYVFGRGDRTGRTEKFWRFCIGREQVMDSGFEVGLVSAATVATRLVRLLDARPRGHHVLNVDGGRSWTLHEHMLAAKAAFYSHRDDAPVPNRLPFTIDRHYSVDSTAFHELVGLDPEDDVEREWRDLAKSW